MTDSTRNDPPEVRLPKGEIASCSLSEIREAAGNSKRHPPEQVQAIADSIQAFGFRNPVQVTRDGVLIAGHGRVAAARKLGLEEVPAIVYDLDEAQVKALRIADNRTAEMSHWDVPVLAEELVSLRDGDFDISAVGFSDEQLDELMAASLEDGTDPVEPDPEARTVSRTGDVWIAGRHRLVCGDPLDPGTVAAAVGETSPSMLVSDLGRSGFPVEEVDAVVAGFGGDVLYVWTDPLAFPRLVHGVREGGFEYRTMLVWDKQRLAGRGKRYRDEHEVGIYATRPGSKSRWRGDRKQFSVLEFDGDKPLSPPVELFARHLKNSSGRKDVVFDPWLGLGTVAIAAETTGRTVVGIESDPGRLDAVLRRWVQRTRGDAFREGKRGKRESFSKLREALG